MSGAVLVALLLVLKLKSLLLFLGAKFKIFIVNPFEGFGFAQVMLTAGSMVVSYVAYVIKFDYWEIALGIVFVLFVHELGHAVVIRARGLRAGAMVFIPFVGGAVTLRRYPRSVFVDAQIGLAGPIFGTIASIAVFELYKFTENELWLWIAHMGFALNLFNLTPVRPLDGGRIAAAITKWMWAIGTIVLVVCWLRWENHLLILLIVMSIFQVYGAINREKNKRFYAITPRKRIAVAAVYFSLLAFLGWATLVTYSLLPTE